MYALLKVSTILFILCFNTCALMKKGKVVVANDDVFEKTEVNLKFPMYSMMIPPDITPKGPNSAKIDPKPVQCSSRNVTNALRYFKQTTKCEPRDTVVKVESPDDIKVYPNVIVVKRCGGLCSQYKECVATERKPFNLYIRSDSDDNGIIFCNHIKLYEDVKCKCTCVKHICPTGQIFDDRYCKCGCNRLAEDKCVRINNRKFIWDPKSCSCKCRHEKLCTTGTKWSADECTCAVY